MRKTIGVRREDKNKWEKRVPLIPADVKELYERFGITTIVQPSAIRIFPDEAYKNAKARIDEDLSNAIALGSDQGRTPSNKE
jgi:saccharopine dehydrogenase (NAD+, L-lysine-forming)